MRIFSTLFFLIAACIVSMVNAGSSLKSYNIENHKVSVSGISSGAAMALQLHVAFSSSVIGSAVVAGPPYYCASNGVLAATTTCMSGLSLTGISMPKIYNAVESYAKQGLIDDPTNLATSRAYVFSGLFDTIVATNVVMKTEQFYKNYMISSNVKTVYSSSATHGFVTDSFGYSCSVLSFNFINNCNYNQAYEITKQMYSSSNIVQPAKGSKMTGTLIEIDQKEFFPSGAKSLSLDTTGYVYVPKQCETGQCKLHVALHGCKQGKESVGLDFITHSGFNQVGDLNDMIILYPQAVKLTFDNPMGCWDWWGYTDDLFATKKGQQMKVIKAMIDRIMN